MEIQLDLGSPDTPLHVVAAGRLDVRNAAAFQQLMAAMQQAAGTGFTCDLSGAQVADAAGRSAVDSVRKRTEEFGGQIVVGRPVVGRPAPAGTLGHQWPDESVPGQHGPSGGSVPGQQGASGVGVPGQQGPSGVGDAGHDDPGSDG